MLKKRAALQCLSTNLVRPLSLIHQITPLVQYFIERESETVFLPIPSSICNSTSTTLHPPLTCLPSAVVAPSTFVYTGPVEFQYQKTKKTFSLSINPSYLSGYLKK